MSGVSLTLKLSLREGSIYYYVERRLNSPEPHYFIVINSDPLAQEIVLLSVITSDIAQVKAFRRHLPGTLVEVGPTDLPGVIPHNSIIDCNSLPRVGLEEFNRKFERGEVKVFPKDAPETLRDALCRAIHASRVVDAPTKSLVRQA